MSTFRPFYFCLGGRLLKHLTSTNVSRLLLRYQPFYRFRYMPAAVGHMGLLITALSEVRFFVLKASLWVRSTELLVNVRRFRKIAGAPPYRRLLLPTVTATDGCRYRRLPLPMVTATDSYRYRWLQLPTVTATDGYRYR